MRADWLNEFERDEWVEVFRPLLEGDSTNYDSLHQFRERMRELQQRVKQAGDYRLSIKDGVTIIRMLGSDLKIHSTSGICVLGDVRMFLELFRHQKFIEAISRHYADCPADSPNLPTKRRSR